MFKWVEIISGSSKFNIQNSRFIHGNKWPSARNTVTLALVVFY